VPEVDYLVEDHVATITMNRPERRNALTARSAHLLADALGAAQANRDVRAVVVTGKGGAFCSGIDLDTVSVGSGHPMADKQLMSESIHHIAAAFDRLEKPSIAAVAGPAMGAGMDISLMADIRLASMTARFSEAYVRLGLVPGNGGCWFLPRIVGKAAAIRLLCTGETIGADEAERIGLVSQVVPDDQLRSATSDLAGRIARNSPLAVQMTRQAVHLAERQDLRTALDLISSHQAVVASTDDHHEAMAAYKERRDGHYVGH
jgi:enoyl-CoA hydratase/carnithine racemase